MMDFHGHPCRDDIPVAMRCLEGSRRGRRSYGYGVVHDRPCGSDLPVAIGRPGRIATGTSLPPVSDCPGPRLVGYLRVAP